MNEASRWNPAWRLPEAQGVSDCPIVYGQGKAPTDSRPSERPLLARTVSLESLHDPLLLQPARGLDMGRGGISLERLPDPLGLEQTRPLLAP